MGFRLDVESLAQVLYQLYDIRQPEDIERILPAAILKHLPQDILNELRDLAEKYDGPRGDAFKKRALEFIIKLGKWYDRHGRAGLPEDDKGMSCHGDGYDYAVEDAYKLPARLARSAGAPEWRARDTGSGNGASIAPLVHKVLRNLINDHYRQKKRRRARDLGGADYIDAYTQDPDDFQTLVPARLLVHLSVRAPQETCSWELERAVQRAFVALRRRDPVAAGYWKLRVVLEVDSKIIYPLKGEDRMKALIRAVDDAVLRDKIRHLRGAFRSGEMDGLKGETLIRRVLGISASTARRRRMRAKELIRKELGKMGFEYDTDSSFDHSRDRSTHNGRREERIQRTGTRRQG